MRINHKLFLLSLVPVLFACQKGQDASGEQDGTEKKEVPAETRTLTFVLPQYEGEDAGDLFKTEWKAGDKIVVHGEYAKDQVTVTLKPEEISADRRSATVTVEGLRPYVNKDCKSDLYASYPASASLNLNHCFYYSRFNNDNVQKMAAYGDGNTFRFQNLSSAITFTVNGDYDSYSFVSKRGVVIGYDSYQVLLTDATTNYRQYIENGSGVLSQPVEADGETENVLYVDGAPDLHHGFSLRMVLDDETVMSYESKAPLALAFGDIVNLGDITGKLQEYTDPLDPAEAKALDGAGTANCYIITEFGSYKFAAVKGNSTEPVKGATEAKVLWETWNNTEDVTPKSVVSEVLYENGYMYVQVKDGYHPGNALVAAVDESGKILWSWHIWVPDTEITSNTYGFSTYTMMDRNLGALIAGNAATTLPESNGLYYQWGRKDPLRASGSLRSKTIATTSPADVWTSEAKQATLDEAREAPTVMYLNEVWTSDSYTELWAATKTADDPCPPGWMIPANKGLFEGYSATIADASWGTYGFTAGAGGSATSVFPYSGGISCTTGDFDSFDAEAGQYTNSRVWLNVVYSDGVKTRAFSLYSTKKRDGTGYAMGNAFSVRCVAIPKSN